MTELYRALRLYVNGFQPSMKLLSKHREGKHVRYVYDPAKTPLQRLLLSRVLPAHTYQELTEVAQALDPIRLFRHLEHLQQAVLGCASSSSPFAPQTPSAPILLFSWENCTAEALPAQHRAPDPADVPHPPRREPERRRHVLDWQRSSKDPFAGEWEQILATVRAHPECSGADLFREFQRRFPERYHPSHIRTLYRGLRKIRAFLLESGEEPWPIEVMEGCTPVPIEAEQQEHEADQQACSVRAAAPSRPLPSSQEQTGARPVRRHSTAEKEAKHTPGTATRAGAQRALLSNGDHGPTRHTSLPLARRNRSLPAMTIDLAIQQYLQEQRGSGRSPKMVEWHQTALGLFQQYLLTQRHLTRPREITEAVVHGWLAFLRATPSATGTLRSLSTMATYARSARAFCRWAVRQRYLERMPFARGTIPRVGPTPKPPIQIIEPEAFDRLLQACRPPTDSSEHQEQAAARNGAILWLLLETGLLVSEVCGLRLVDVDRQHAILRVRAKGSKQRPIALGPHSLRHLLSYLDQHRLKEKGLEGKRAGEEPLFLSETGRPLTTNAITLVFARLNKRAGITSKCVSPSLLRETFVERSLQARGDPCTLQELLRHTDLATATRSQHLSEQVLDEHKRKETPGDLLP